MMMMQIFLFLQSIKEVGSLLERTTALCCYLLIEEGQGCVFYGKSRASHHCALNYVEQWLDDVPIISQNDDHEDYIEDPALKLKCAFLKMFLRYLCLKDDNMDSLAISTAKACLRLAVSEIEQRIQQVIPIHIKEELHSYLGKELIQYLGLQGPYKKGNASINDVFHLLKKGAFSGRFCFKNPRDRLQFIALIGCLTFTVACGGEIVVFNGYKHQNKLVKYKDLSFQLEDKGCNLKGAPSIWSGPTWALSCIFQTKDQRCSQGRSQSHREINLLTISAVIAWITNLPICIMLITATTCRMCPERVLLDLQASLSNLGAGN